MKRQLAFSAVFVVVGIVGLIVALVYKDYPIAVFIAFTTGFNLAMPLAHQANGTAKEAVAAAQAATSNLTLKQAEVEWWKSEAAWFKSEAEWRKQRLGL